jgi:hypothetical protein
MPKTTLTFGFREALILSLTAIAIAVLIALKNS